jgi:hypothetical protein
VLRGQCRHHSLDVQETGSGLLGSSTEFLASLNLKSLANLEPSEYPKWLEDQTQALMARFPIAERWGPARKSINIFMEMASRNQFLCDEYKLHRFGLCSKCHWTIRSQRSCVRGERREIVCAEGSSRHSVLSNSKGGQRSIPRACTSAQALFRSRTP